MKHLKEKEMNYSEHFFFTLKYGIIIIKHGFKLIIHGIFPFLFESSEEELLLILNKKFKRSEITELRKKMEKINF